MCFPPKNRSRVSTGLMAIAGCLLLIEGQPRLPASPFISAANAQSEQSKVQDRIAGKLDLFLTKMVPFGYWGAILVAVDDQIILNKGYGWADEAKRVPNTADTVFRLDSVTKQFTAAAILKLEMQGRLATQHSITKYFDNVPEDKRGITIHHLLTHTSGIVSGTETYYQDRSRDGILSVAFRQPVSFPPGDGFSYSNIGYVVLAAIVEKVSGQSYERFIIDNLFRPAGMESTGRVLVEWKGKTHAHRYEAGKDNGPPLDEAHPDWNHAGSGDMLSTTGDMFRWHKALMGDRILSAAAKDKMYTPYSRDYGYGWSIKSTKEGRVIQQNGGSSNGSARLFTRLIDRNTTIMIFSNNDGESMLFGSGIIDHVRKIALGGDVHPPPEVRSTDRGALSRYTGSYELGDRNQFLVEVENAVPVIRVFGQNAIDAVLRSDPRDLDAARRANTIAERVLAALIQGDLAPLEDALANKNRAADYYRHIRQTTAQKPFQGYRVLGTVPDQDESSDLITFFQLEFDTDERLFRFHWNAGKIQGLGGSAIPEPVRLAAFPVDDTWFAGYHVATSKSIKFRFEQLDNEIDLVLESGIRARRAVPEAARPRR